MFGNLLFDVALRPSFSPPLPPPSLEINERYIDRVGWLVGYKICVYAYVSQYFMILVIIIIIMEVISR